MDEIIAVKDLTFSFDGKSNAVESVSFTVKPGSYVSLIGHNGSGKSTLAKLLIGLLETKQGTISLFGENINSRNILKLRNKVGIVFQNPDNQFIGSTVRDDIAFGLENRCIPTKDMDDIILEFSRKVQMENYLDKEPINLSGGQKQRVAIAGVLALKPSLIIFDEATAMLDPKGRREIREIIKEMRIENPDLTIFSITHDLEEANMSDEVLVMNEGKMVAEFEAADATQEKIMAAILKSDNK